MAPPEAVIVDTSAFYAFVSASDRYHAAAVQTFDRIADRNQEIWTTSYALVETVALVDRRLGFDVLSQVLDFIDSYVHVFWVESVIHARSLREFMSPGGRSLSLVDWSVALVSQMKSGHVFTFDKGFDNRGITVMPR